MIGISTTEMEFAAGHNALALSEGVHWCGGWDWWDWNCDQGGWCSWWARRGNLDLTELVVLVHHTPPQGSFFRG